MAEITLGLIELGFLVAGLFLLYFFMQVALVAYEEFRARSNNALAETLRQENEMLLRQIGVLKDQTPDQRRNIHHDGV